MRIFHFTKDEVWELVIIAAAISIPLLMFIGAS